MATYLVDTNIFLEVLLSGPRKDECKRLLRLLRDGKKTGMVTDYTVHSIIVIMERFNKLEGLKTFLLSLLAYKGLRVYPTTISEEVRAVDATLKQHLDMDDAIQYSSALSAEAEAIISFDKHLNNLKVPRLEPADAI